MTYKFNRRYFTEEQIQDYLNNRDHVVVLAVTSLKNGKTSMAPAWMVYHDGKFYFPGSRSAIKKDLIEDLQETPTVEGKVKIHTFDLIVLKSLIGL